MRPGVPRRAGWFGEFYEESRTWIATPPWFRNCVSHEQRALTLRNWFPSLLDGLLQTEDYAREILAVSPGVTEDEVNARLAARMKRQVILTRDDPPTAWFLVDDAALHRRVGSSDVMAAQMAHLVGSGATAERHDPGGAGSRARRPAGRVLAVTERAAYVETAVAGQVFEDAEHHCRLLTRFDTLRNDALRASESLAFIERMCEEWKQLAQEQLLRGQRRRLRRDRVFG